MTRLPQGKADRGSQKWLQQSVVLAPHVLQPTGLATLRWCSPLADDAYAEYMDGGFLDRLSLPSLKPELSEFWPRSGPRWDGLAQVGHGGVVLVEAKAHVREFLSTPCAASGDSAAQIASSLARVKSALGADDRSDWMRTFYQYANRLAHLWWLCEQGVDAHLLLIGFLNDDDLGGPGKAETWKALYQAADHALGLPTRHPLSKRVLHVAPDVRSIPAL